MSTFINLEPSRAPTRIAEALQAAMVARGERTKVTQDDVIAGLYAEANRSGEGSSH